MKPIYHAIQALALWTLVGVGNVVKDTRAEEKPPIRPHHEPKPPARCPKCAIGSFVTTRHPDIWKAAAGVRLGKCLRKRCGYMARMTPEKTP